MIKKKSRNICTINQTKHKSKMQIDETMIVEKRGNQRTKNKPVIFPVLLIYISDTC